MPETTGTHPVPPSSFSNVEVERYYDVNTRAFLKRGVGRGASVMHRPVWGPGVRTRTQALHFLHTRLLEQLDQLGGRENARALDLGCGAGATLAWLRGQGLGRGVGWTNSQNQVDFANTLWRQQDSSLRFRYVDFCSPAEALFAETMSADPDQPDAEDFDLVYAIESFVHATDPRQFFQNARRALRPGGRLLICDDFLAVDKPTSQQSRAIEDFKSGWRLSSLMTPHQARRWARKAKFEPIEDLNLTPYLKTRTARARLVRLGVSSFKNWTPRLELQDHPKWLNLLGGNALRECIETQATQYRYLVWRAIH